MRPSSPTPAAYRHLSQAHRPRAFSLIELAVVLIVVAVIAAIAIPTFQSVITSSQDRSDAAELNGVLRNAYALARARGNDLPSAQDVADALAEIDAAAPGVGAYIEISPTARLYTQTEWDASPVVPGGVRAYVYLSDPSNDRVGVASMSPTSTSTCVAAVLSSGSPPESFTLEVASAEDCDGYLALGGYVPPVAPTAGEQIEAGMVLIGDESTPGWDDLEITNNATTTYLADDFNRADGPLGPPYLDLSFAGLPPLEVRDNAATGSLVPTTHVSVLSVPAASQVAISATLADVLPEDGSSAQLVVADLDTFSAEAMVQAGTYPGGLARYRHQVSVPGAPQQYVYADAGTAAAADTVRLTRANPTLSTVRVNGQLRSTLNRSQIATVTGSITNYGATDPTLCNVSPYAASAVNNESHLQVGAATVNSDGTFSVFVTTTGPVKLGVHCPGLGMRFPNGAIWASGADTIAPTAGQTLALPPISMS